MVSTPVSSFIRDHTRHFVLCTRIQTAHNRDLSGVDRYYDLIPDHVYRHRTYSVSQDVSVFVQLEKSKIERAIFFSSPFLQSCIIW